MKKLTRSIKGRVLFGTCAGIGEYFDIDPVIIRILFIVSGIGFFAYLIMSLIIPNEDTYSY